MFDGAYRFCPLSALEAPPLLTRKTFGFGQRIERIETGGIFRCPENRLAARSRDGQSRRDAVRRSRLSLSLFDVVPGGDSSRVDSLMDIHELFSFHHGIFGCIRLAISRRGRYGEHLPQLSRRNDDRRRFRVFDVPSYTSREFYF